MGNRNRNGVACGFVMALAGLAVAQDAPKPLLQGPKVVEDKMPGTQESFMQDGDRVIRDQTPQRLVEAALRKLLADDAPENVRPSKEQAEQIRAIEADARGAIRRYTADHAEEIRRLTRIIEASATRGEDRMGEATMQEQTSSRDVERARARLLEIRQGAPSPADAQTRIWRLLNADQRVFVEAELARLRTAMEDRMREAYVERRMREQQGSSDTAPPQRPMARLDFLPEELRQRIAALPPEQRERLIVRLRERHLQSLRETDAAKRDTPPRSEPARTPTGSR